MRRIASTLVVGRQVHVEQDARVVDVDLEGGGIAGRKQAAQAAGGLLAQLDRKRAASDERRMAAAPLVDGLDDGRRMPSLLCR